MSMPHRAVFILFLEQHGDNKTLNTGIYTSAHVLLY